MFKKLFQALHDFFTGANRTTPRPIPAQIPDLQVNPAETENAAQDEIERRNQGAHRIYKRVAFVDAHTESNGGCASYPVVIPELSSDKKKHMEYKISCLINSLVLDLINIESFSMFSKRFSRNGRGVRGVSKLLKKWKPCICFATHENSVGHNSDVEGLELLINKKWKGTWVEDEARRFIRLYLHYVGPTTLRRDGGIFWIDSDDRGANNVKSYERYCKYFTILTEVAFIGKRTKSAALQLENNGIQKTAKAYAEFCLGNDVPPQG